MKDARRNQEKHYLFEMTKESAKRIIELMLIGIEGLKDAHEQTFKMHMTKIREEVKNVIDGIY